MSRQSRRQTVPNCGTVEAEAALTSALSAAPHLQSMQTVDEDDLGHSPLEYIPPVDRQVRRHGYICIHYYWPVYT